MSSRWENATLKTILRLCEAKWHHACTRTNCGTCVHACTFERIYSSLNCDTCIFLWHPTEEAQADAEYTAAVNELIGLEQTDDVTPQAPLSTVSPIGNIPIAVDNIMFIFAII